MDEKPQKNPPHRPQKDIDWKLFEDLCEVQCTQVEIAHMLRVDEDTLCTRTRDHYGEPYSVVYKKYSSPGKCSLRRMQFSQAKDKPAIAIWLGKQWLGQRDYPADEAGFNGELSEFIQYLKDKYKAPYTGPDNSACAKAPPLPPSQE